jgi:hypothetical protein
MNKTLDEYMSDPDIANEPEALREVLNNSAFIHLTSKIHSNKKIRMNFSPKYRQNARNLA